MHYLTIPAIWRNINSPIPAYARLNATLGLNVWRPSNSTKFFTQGIVLSQIAR